MVWRVLTCSLTDWCVNKVNKHVVSLLNDGTHSINSSCTPIEGTKVYIRRLQKKSFASDRALKCPARRFCTSSRSRRWSNTKSLVVPYPSSITWNGVCSHFWPGSKSLESTWNARLNPRSMTSSWSSSGSSCSPWPSAAMSISWSSHSAKTTVEEPPTRQVRPICSSVKAVSPSWQLECTSPCLSSDTYAGVSYGIAFSHWRIVSQSRKVSIRKFDTFHWPYSFYSSWYCTSFDYMDILFLNPNLTFGSTIKELTGLFIPNFVLKMWKLPLAKRLALSATTSTYTYPTSGIVFYGLIGWMTAQFFRMMQTQIYGKSIPSSAGPSFYYQIREWKKCHGLVCDVVQHIDHCFGASFKKKSLLILLGLLSKFWLNNLYSPSYLLPFLTSSSTRSRLHLTFWWTSRKADPLMIRRRVSSLCSAVSSIWLS